jgi:2,3-diaminopropionate biosynthesis protein SbnA
MIADSVMCTIGMTPLVAIKKFYQPINFKLFAKFESLNPGGSIKDRSAFLMLKHAIEKGEIKSDTTIIESSSGNMAIGLAQACAYYNLSLICVIDPKVCQHNINIIHAYGAKTVLVESPDPKTSEFQPARIKKVKCLLNEISNSIWLNQYANIYNARAHHITAKEIVEEVNGNIDFLFVPVSTGGTIRGCLDYIKSQNIATKVIAVDAVGSTIFSNVLKKRLLPGHAGIIKPPLLKDVTINEIIYVSDLECIISCRHLVKTEGMLCGASSGASLFAVMKYLDNIHEGSTCVVILPDRGDRYLDTVFSDQWVDEHFGKLPSFKSVFQK